MAAASNDFKAIAAQKRLLPDSKYRSLPLENALFDCPRLECREPETRGTPIFCNPEKRCLSRRRTCKHLRACLESSRFQLRAVLTSIGSWRFGSTLSVVSGKASKSLLNERERLSNPKVRSTIQRSCRPESLALPRPFHDEKGALRNSGYPFNQLAGITSVCPDSSAQESGEIDLVVLYGSITVFDPRRMDHHN